MSLKTRIIWFLRDVRARLGRESLLNSGRIFKNKKMPGHMGAERVTVQNLKVVRVRPEDNVLLVKGGIPGSK